MKTVQTVCRLAGDRGLVIEFGDKIDPDINARVRAMADALEHKSVAGIEQIIPTYRSLLLVYDPLRTGPRQLMAAIEALGQTLDHSAMGRGKVVKIPVCYGGEYGPDMANVMAASGLDETEVVLRHSAPEYLIYMVGFTPGFPFLGGLDEKLSTPRLQTPRTKVPEGSVGIANNQTGVYPVESPGGWQLIGRTPIRLFDPKKENPFLYRAGDRIKFVPVTEDEYQTLKKDENLWTP